MIGVGLARIHSNDCKKTGRKIYILAYLVRSITVVRKLKKICRRFDTNGNKSRDE